MSEDIKSNFVIRKMEDGDYNFVMNSWLKSYRQGSLFAKRIRDNVYYDYHHTLVSRILARGAHVLVAADVIDPSVIMGYLVVEVPKEGVHEGRPIIHYCYVKSPFRRMGVASELLKITGIDFKHTSFSHWTKPVDEIIKKYGDLTYNPYLL